MKRIQEEEERKYKFYEDLFDFPKDPERWKEEDLREVWADAPAEMTDEKATLRNAWNQIQTYRSDIPSVFTTNAMTLISDGTSAALPS